MDNHGITILYNLTVRKQLHGVGIFSDMHSNIKVRNMPFAFLLYTSVYLAHHELFRAKVGKGGIKILKCYRVYAYLPSHTTRHTMKEAVVVLQLRDWTAYTMAQ